MAQVIDINELLQHGATLHGVPVSKVIVVTVDGRKQEIEPVLAEPEVLPEQPELTDMESAVLAVVAGMKPGFSMSTSEIAEKSGFSNSGKMREFLKSLAKAGRVRATAKGYEKLA